MAKNVKLPEKISDLLELALNDAQAVQRRSGVELDMGEWLFFNHDGTCTACVAGAVMLRTLGATREQADELGGVALGAVTHRVGDIKKLLLIDEMRSGFFRTGHRELDAKLRDLVTSRLDGGRAPWHIYRKCVRILREAGL